MAKKTILSSDPRVRWTGTDFSFPTGYSLKITPEDLKKYGIQKYASGGRVHDHGMINSTVPGRTDRINIDVPANAFVIPADIVSALGEGNSESGRSILDSYFGPAKRATGGKVPIVAAGGEYLVDPAKLEEKFGSLDHGLSVMDHFTQHVRKETIKTLKGLKKPRK